MTNKSTVRRENLIAVIRRGFTLSDNLDRTAYVIHMEDVTPAVLQQLVGAAARRV